MIKSRHQTSVFNYSIHHTIDICIQLLYTTYHRHLYTTTLYNKCIHQLYVVEHRHLYTPTIHHTTQTFVYTHYIQRNIDICVHLLYTTQHRHLFILMYLLYKHIWQMTSEMSQCVHLYLPQTLVPSCKQLLEASLTLDKCHSVQNSV